MSEADALITATQIIAGRALLAWSQEDLASAASVAKSVVADFELTEQESTLGALAAMRAALEANQIRFGEEVERVVEFPPIAPIASGQPMRWIDASDLDDWAERRGGQDGMPELLSRLIRAEYGQAAKIRFPSGDSVIHPGWDGQSEVGCEKGLVPDGGAGWEIGAQRTRHATKATKDYETRTKEPLGLDRWQTTFVFVTPRRWSGKDKWVAKRRAEGLWRDVRAIDGDDLVHWIESHPNVAHWLAVKIGKRPQGVRSIPELWDQWSGATRRPMTTELTLVGRDHEAASLLAWLAKPPSAFYLHAESVDEALAFLHATVEMLPPAYRDAYQSRMLAPADLVTATALSDSLTPLVLALSEAEPGEAQMLARKGHHVLLAFGAGSDIPSNAMRLARPPRALLHQALRNMGYGWREADNLSRDAGRSLTILRRLMPPATGRRPAWSQAPLPRSLLAALLVGGWYEALEADREAMVALSGLAYDDFSRSLAPLISGFDTPIRKLDEAWKLASPRDAWFLLAGGLTTADVDRFVELFDQVFKEVDPAFDMPVKDRWLAQVHSKVVRHSGLLRQSVADTMILLCLFGDRAQLAHGAAEKGERAVRRLLSDASPGLWWSISTIASKLAEAAPRAFLEAVDQALSCEPSPLRVLFEGETNSSSSRLPELLWALERLAWDPELLPKVASLLARLDMIDPGGRNMARPANSLQRTFLSWSPQTNATLLERLDVIDMLRQRYPLQSWRLLLGLPPKPHAFTTASSYPQWRDFGSERREPLTEDLVAGCVLAVVKRLSQDVGADASRWEDLLEEIGNLETEDRLSVGKTLLAQEPHIAEPAARDAVRTALRKLLMKHREFADATWAIPEPELGDFQLAYDRLEPEDLVWRHAWLFANGTGASRWRPGDWRAQQDADERTRDEALNAIAAAYGKVGVDRLLELAGRPQWIGESVMRAPGAAEFRDELLREGLAADDGSAWELAKAQITVGLHLNGPQWIFPSLSAAQSSGDARAATRLLQHLPAERPAWDLAARTDAVDRRYWETVNLWALQGDRGDLEFAVEKLLAVGRKRHASNLIAARLEVEFAPDLIVEVLKLAANDDQDAPDPANEPQLWLHSVETTLDHLAERPGVAATTLIQLEWLYFPLLRHSDQGVARLQDALASDPGFFMMILKLAFGPDPESEVVEPVIEDAEGLRPAFEQAWTLLEAWRRVPGGDKDGAVTSDALISWVQSVRSMAAECGRLGVADHRIGKVLSGARRSAESPWPPPAICAAIELIGSPAFCDAFVVGVYNARGVTMRMPSDGGGRERTLAQRYRQDAKVLAMVYPTTSNLLVRIAEGFEDRARREDRDAEHRGWM